MLQTHLEDTWTPPSPSTASRLPPVRSRGSSRGTILNFKSNRTIWYESAIERRTAYAFLARPDVADLWDQPAPVTYVDATGRSKKHTFDFLVLLTDGSRVAVAVKPFEKADRICDALERIAKQGAAAHMADRISLVTERDLPKWLVSNAELIHSSMREHPNDTDTLLSDLIASLTGHVTIGDLVACTGRGGAAFRAIMRFIGSGKLILAQRSRITRRSLVAKASVNSNTERR